MRQLVQGEHMWCQSTADSTREETASALHQERADSPRKCHRRWWKTSKRKKLTLPRMGQLGAEALCGWGEGIVSFEEIRLVWTQILFLLLREAKKDILVFRVRFRPHEIRKRWTHFASWRQVDEFGASLVKDFCSLAVQTGCEDEQAMSLRGLLYGSHAGYPYYLYYRQPSVLGRKHCELHLALSH